MQAYVIQKKCDHKQLTKYANLIAKRVINLRFGETVVHHIITTVRLY